MEFVPRGPIHGDAEDKLRQESRNGTIQAEFVIFQASEWKAETRLTPALIRKMQELAINQIYRCAGYFRDGEISIQGVAHQPPPARQVDGLVQQMCHYVTSSWASTLIHLAAYLMWRMNWIHPFFGGNGRTARAVSYLILCARLGFVLPGTKTIPDLIVEHREPYFAALQSADAAWEIGRLDVSDMQALLSSLLAQQLVAIHSQATTGTPPTQQG